MESPVSALLCVIGGIAVAGMALLIGIQETIVYSPEPRSYKKTPKNFRRRFQNIRLISSDGVRLHAWFIKFLPHCRGPTILFLQQNGGNISHNLAMVCIMLKKLQCNALMLSYRGYGESDGFPSQQGITKDAQAALDHLVQRTDIDISRIIVYGRSLGGAVAAALTKNNPDKVAALILENTFTSALDMAGVFFPFLKWFIGRSSSSVPKIMNFLVRSPWSTIDIIDKIEQPVLFLSGRKDETVPPSHMDLLYAKAAARNQQCLFEKFDEGTHMKTWEVGGNHFWETIKDFLDRRFPVKKRLY